MSELDRERREMASVLERPGLTPDPKLRITRRTFVHRSCLAGAATVAQTFAWWPLINTIDMAYAAEDHEVGRRIHRLHFTGSTFDLLNESRVNRLRIEVSVGNPSELERWFGGVSHIDGVDQRPPCEGLCNRRRAC